MAGRLESPVDSGRVNTTSSLPGSTFMRAACPSISMLAATILNALPGCVRQARAPGTSGAGGRARQGPCPLPPANAGDGVSYWPSCTIFTCQGPWPWGLRLRVADRPVVPGRRLRCEPVVTGQNRRILGRMAQVHRAVLGERGFELLPPGFIEGPQTCHHVRVLGGYIRPLARVGLHVVQLMFTGRSPAASGWSSRRTASISPDAAPVGNRSPGSGRARCRRPGMLSGRAGAGYCGHRSAPARSMADPHRSINVGSTSMCAVNSVTSRPPVNSPCGQ